MPNPKLTFAISHYDRYIPLIEGIVQPEGFEVEPLHVGQSEQGRLGSARHERMINNLEFDVAELSLSSYLMARAQNLPFTAIPVFPRRLFSQSQIWVRSDGSVRQPKDLIGRRVGLNTFQTTLSVLAKGDLQREYSVPWREIEWVVVKDEVVSFHLPEGLRLTKAPEGADLGHMLQRGEIDAVFRPHPPRLALEADTSIKRLFEDAKSEEASYFQKHGYFPIMHLVAFQDRILERYPDAAMSFLRMLDASMTLASRLYDDPNWSQMAWGRLHLEEERRLLARNIWPNGISRNRANLEAFMAYSLDQGLIDRMIPVETLFYPTTLLT